MLQNQIQHSNTTILQAMQNYNQPIQNGTVINNNNKIQPNNNINSQMYLNNTNINNNIKFPESQYIQSAKPPTPALIGGPNQSQQNNFNTSEEIKSKLNHFQHVLKNIQDTLSNSDLSAEARQSYVAYQSKVMMDLDIFKTTVIHNNQTKTKNITPHQ